MRCRGSEKLCCSNKPGRYVKMTRYLDGFWRNIKKNNCYGNEVPANNSVNRDGIE